MNYSKLVRKQIIQTDIQTAWDFFSSPKNLKEITPEHLGFEITSLPLPEKMYPGQIITYIVKPILGIPLKWMTEITQVQAPYFFIDQQLVGPYALWHHQHHFKEVPEGIEMTDIIHYRLPLGPLGTIARKLFVEKQLDGIFNYRNEIVEKVFNSKSAANQGEVIQMMGV